jgi:hypothetical protein
MIMGYRSDVRCVIYAPRVEDAEGKYESLKLLMNTRYAQVMEEFGGCVHWNDRLQLLDFDIEDVKWYDGYADVIMFTDMYQNMPTLGYCVEFIRVGEESDDVETHEEGVGDNWVQGYLSVRREIVLTV